MDEETVVFKVLIHHRNSLYPVVTHDNIFFKANVMNGVSGKTLKKRLAAQLKCTYKGRDVKFVVGCYNAFTKDEGRRVVPISAAIYRFTDAYGEIFGLEDVRDIHYQELTDKDILFTCHRSSKIARYLTCDVIDVIDVL